MNEEKTLLGSSIPDKIWQKYHMEMSSSGLIFWINKRKNVHIFTDAIQYVFEFPDHITLSCNHSFVDLFTDSKRIDLYFC